MAINKYDVITFPNYGILTSKLDDTDLEQLRKEISTISVLEDASDKLAGNIEKEFFLHKSIEKLQELILPLCVEYDRRFDYFKKINVLTKSGNLVLDELWVNFQKKHEFNPSHTHPGLLSFVIWLDIPFSIDDELSVANTYKSSSPVPGNFQFLYTNILGEIFPYSIPVDKTFNGTIALFPSKLTHLVYPFYTSDNFRITVSGNFKIK
jgi:hypothetical protein